MSRDPRPIFAGMQTNAKFSFCSSAYSCLTACLIMTMLFALSHSAQAQVSVKDSSLLAGLVIVEGGFGLPAGDLADRFGPFGNAAFSIQIKNRKNWVIGGVADAYFGGSVKEDSLFRDLEGATGALIGSDGLLHIPILAMRGYGFGLQVGKITNWLSPNPNSGIILMGGAGFTQHKIRATFEEEFLPQLAGDRTKYYDRLTNGLYLSQFIGYHVHGEQTFINGRIGIECRQGFTQGRRDFQADLGFIENESRLDLQFTLKAAWVLPIYEKPEIRYYYY
jgi:hypothetical protein